MHTRRVGPTLYAGAGAPAQVEFPGIPPQRDTRRATVTSGLMALLVHAGVFGLLVLFAWLAPPELIEQVIPLEVISEPVPESEPAPAPRAIAETRGSFAPAPQAVIPQIINPHVAARAAPAVAAEVLEMEAVASVAAPREVTRARVEAEHVSAVRSVASATTTPVAVAPVAPALKGPIEVNAPSGPSVGPRQVVAIGDDFGLAPPQALGHGSSVREGIASDRDVDGSEEGPRLANVNTRVGSNLLGGGPGGSGSGLGVTFEECTTRPEVQAYMSLVKERMYERWVLPAGISPNQEVILQFKLDPSGSATNVRLLRAADEQLGESAVSALRAASPFPPMNPRVRCLAADRLNGYFRNPG